MAESLGTGSIQDPVSKDAHHPTQDCSDEQSPERSVVGIKKPVENTDFQISQQAAKDQKWKDIPIAIDRLRSAIL